MRKGVMPMSKPTRGPVDRNTRPGKPLKKKPVGNDPKGAHPMTKATGNVKMNRNLSGVDKRRGSKGKVGAKSLEGKYF